MSRSSRPRQVARRVFRVFNRWFMVPLARARLGAWLGSPIGGWIVLLRVRGRRTGLLRDVPLNYVVAEGSVWVMAGFGSRTDWLRNVVANPRLSVLLPGQSATVSCVAELVDDPQVRRRVVPGLFRSYGIWGYLAGADPWRSSPDEILATTADVPLLRLRPEGAPLVAGPDDPGGRRWVKRQLAVAAVFIELVAGVIWYSRRRPA